LSTEEFLIPDRVQFLFPHTVSARNKKRRKRFMRSAALQKRLSCKTSLAGQVKQLFPSSLQAITAKRSG
jgi:hypothetical protein